MTNAFQLLRFKFLDKTGLEFARSIRHDRRLEGFRSYLRKLCVTLGGEPGLSSSEALVRDFCDELTQAFNEAKAEWGAIDRDLLKWDVPTLGGAIATRILSLTLPAAKFVVGEMDELNQAILKRQELRKKVPVSVFVDLLRR